MTSMSSIPCDLFVDISSADCDLVFSRLSDALEVLLPQQTLMAVSKKQALQCDVATFCQQNLLRLTDQGEIDGEVYFLIQLAQQ